MPKLLFVDTNIYLDFYRIRGDVKISFLTNIDGIKSQVIVTDQVEMEYKKNRQNAIFESMGNLKTFNSISVPGILSQDESVKSINGSVKDINKSINKLMKKYNEIIEQPYKHDPVFISLEKLFTKKSDIDLFRKSEDRYMIRELAEKRYNLGYPPRKNDDTSYGDAINWEWITHIAKLKKADIWIVSRDRDYGYQYSDKSFLNDWLVQEFKERVGKKNKIILTQKLSEALKEFKIAVTEEEVKEEERIIETPTFITSNYSKDEIDKYAMLAKNELARYSKLYENEAVKYLDWSNKVNSAIEKHRREFPNILANATSAAINQSNEVVKILDSVKKNHK